MPDGFDMNNSPADLVVRRDVGRPLVMLSSSGTALIAELGDPATVAYVASLRNLSATVRALANGLGPIAFIGAGSRGQFRDEDQAGCAWLAKGLEERGWAASDAETAAIVDRWAGAPPNAIGESASVAWLRRSGQLDDLAFILDHVDDLDLVCRIDGREVRVVDSVDVSVQQLA